MIAVPSLLKSLHEVRPSMAYDPHRIKGRELTQGRIGVIGMYVGRCEVCLEVVVDETDIDFGMLPDYHGESVGERRPVKPVAESIGPGCQKRRYREKQGNADAHGVSSRLLRRYLF